MKVIELSKEDYQGKTLVFEYTSDFYYDIERSDASIFSIKLVKKQFENTVTKSFTSELFPSHAEDPMLYGLEVNGEIVGYLEVDYEAWHNRLRVSELLIEKEYRHQGYGSLLLNKAKEIAKEKGCRELVLETQSCNSKAIDAYLKSGYIVNGIDLSAYSNDDILNKEVRIEMIRRL